MELRQDLDKGKATFTAVSEFLLTHPVLSFGVRDVAHSRLRHTEVLPAEEESESLTTGKCVCVETFWDQDWCCFFIVVSVFHRLSHFLKFYIWFVFVFRRLSRTNRVQVWNPNQTLLCTHQVSLFSPSFCRGLHTKCQVEHCILTSLFAWMEALIPAA